MAGSRAHHGPDFEHRKTRVQAVVELFQARPKEWITAHTLAHVGGFCAWRSRVADARKILARDGGIVEWNGEQIESAYRFLPYTPLGKDPAQYREQSLF